jgi:hypothetical protein
MFNTINEFMDIIREGRTTYQCYGRGDGTFLSYLPTIEYDDHRVLSYGTSIALERRRKILGINIGWRLISSYKKHEVPQAESIGREVNNICEAFWAPKGNI